MDCTTAMDSSSTTSERSSHASSPVVKQQPLSPTAANNNNTTSSNNNAGIGSPRHSPLGPPPPGPPLGMPHPLSPPPVRLAQNLQAHLPPPGLGLLGTLGVSGMLGHHGALDLMAHHGPPRSYNSPPPISSSDPTANECKLVDYRGQKVAAFIIAGDTMLCLPQAFELFLKHLVGGLHTVYTKLKRLDIVPLVCNVEQVRILRGLGAIQPGVNRCKLLSCKDFDILYKDCTTARPGRPPKRAPVGLSLAASHLHHQQMKKHRLDNGDYPYENGHMDIPRMEKSPLLANGYNHPPHLSHMQFMQLPHPAAAHSALLSPGMPHGLARPDGSVIKNQGMPPAMEAIARSGIWENCRAAYEDIVKHLERLREERNDVDRALALDQKVQDLSSQNGSPNGHSPVLNLSKSGGGGGSLGSNDGDNDVDHSGSEVDGPETALTGAPHSPRSNPEDDEEDNLSDPEDEDEKDQDIDDGADLPIPAVPNSDSQQALNYSTLASAVAAGAGGGALPQDPSISSTETLLRNIQGLLKVAADNARQQERQINYEKAELKMDVLREREVKDSLERQLVDEQKIRVLYQKRFRKERKARRRLQEQLELEMKRRAQLEEALKASGANPEALRLINDTIAVDQQSQPPPPPLARPTPTGSASLAQEQPPRSESPQAPPPPPAYGGPQTPREPPQQSAVAADSKAWNAYSGLDLMSSGAAFWQNYSESLAQELEMERKSRQQQVDRDVKSPLQDRANYYKNSVLFTSAT